MAGEEAPNRRRGPGRPRAERVSGAVLDAVVVLVAERGLGALTMDAVAARAGVSKPAMYRRWPTKQDLVIAAAESRIGPLTVPDLGDFRAELHAVLTARMEAYRQPGVARLLAGVIGSSAEAEAEPAAYRAYTARVTSETRHILERAVARGEIAPEVDVATTTTLIAAPLLFRTIAEHEAPDQALVDTVTELVARAVAGPR
ncbi:TetR/AcrR family transcriptional regulator [Streptomyces sp. HNM0574]|uniref:TetR/AcrR family transcriptional regulator n=1 Tax=Streptomyces sp. HNM0574 TaxID=2714954 RepID=UPI00146A24A1|nr:TetR/AcrR family transcriptional regulator [Streptomyces sp. HNM0574]NLU69463.1 TetR/AcrR family transcriptional regulator [Streptomyces sp. HNM0574]